MYPFLEFAVFVTVLIMRKISMNRFFPGEKKSTFAQRDADLKQLPKVNSAEKRFPNRNL